MSESAADRQPRQRLVVLGASNVTRGLRTFCETAANLWGQPLDVLAAIGHGRSFGVTSSVFGRRLPSIRTCELWQEWRTREALPTAGIITDIGNDIMYGSSPLQIADWVQDCTERLREHCQAVVISGLPIQSVKKLTPQRFNILRSIFFPSSQLTYCQAIERAIELDQRITEIANRFGLPTTAPDATWFGVDPIHIRRRHWPTAWKQMLGPLRGTEPYETQSSGSASWRLRRLRARHRWMFGIEQRFDQPIWYGPDGSRLSLY